jgi:mono/diheme cytochrome c family protein
MRSIRRHVPATLVAAAVMLAAVSAIAADAAVDKPKPLDGKELYMRNCKVCHGAKAEAGEYTPMTLIQEQWEEFFTEVYSEVHAKVVAPASAGNSKSADSAETADKKVTDIIDAPMLEAIRKFCVDHAADSEQPMTCG